MENISEELVANIVVNAQRYINTESESKLLDIATKQWVEINNTISQVRPVGSEIWEFLKDVCSKVILELKQKYEVLTIVTLVAVVRQLLETLITNYGMTNLEMYQLPIQLLAAIIFSKILDEASERLK